jgi:hypothetical protein
LRLSVRALTVLRVRPAVALSALIAASALFRSLAAWRHSTPRFFPDEYIYAALGRSLGHGSLEIRGAPVHFPGILEPLLAAPIWRLFPTETAYHLVQTENAVVASLVAIPVFLLARWVRLGNLYSFLCALYALLVPSLVLVGFTLSDVVAYPLVLAAIAAGLRAIDEPTRRRQVAFLVFAALASLARVQFVVLVPAYLAAAVVTERGAVVRRHKVALAAVVPVLVVALVAGLGYYARLGHTRLSVGFFAWVLRESFLLTLVAGVVVVPGAIAALLRPGDRRERVLAVFFGTFAALLLAEAAVYSADSSEFKERYLFALLPVLPIAFGLYLKRLRQLRPIALALAAVIVAAAARLPISAYTAGLSKTDSQFLLTVSYAEQGLGVSSTSLLVAGLATAGAMLAIAVAFVGLRWLALGATIAIAAVVTAGATAHDLVLTRAVRSLLPPDLAWVDRAARGPVTAVATPLSQQKHLLDTLYWNKSIEREVVLDDALPSDSFSAPKLRIGRDGELLDTTGEILFDESGSLAVFAGAERLASGDALTLWRAGARPRLRLLVEDRYRDGWLGRSGRIRAWPLHGEREGTQVSFTLSLPPDWKRPVELRVGRARFTVAPATRTYVACRTAAGPLDLRFSSRDAVAGGEA